MNSVTLPLSIAMQDLATEMLRISKGEQVPSRDLELLQVRLNEQLDEAISARQDLEEDR